MRTMSRVETEHAALLGGHTRPEYGLTNDNRFEQHHWVWLTS